MALAIQSSSPAPRSDPPNKETRNRLIREVALQTLVEIGALTLITGFCSQFAATREVKTEFIRTATWVAGLNLLTRSSAAGYKYLDDNHLFIRVMGCIADYFAPVNFAYIFHDITTRCFIHEMGHVAAWFLISKNVKIQIYVLDVTAAESLRWGHAPFFEKCSDFSTFGRYLGLSSSRFIVMAGGALANVISAQIALIFGVRIKKSYPQLSKYLICSAIISVINEATYALSARSLSQDYKNSNVIHDFSVLWKEYKIHPIAAAATIVALPAITTLAYLYSRKIKPNSTITSASVSFFFYTK